MFHPKLTLQAWQRLIEVLRWNTTVPPNDIFISIAVSQPEELTPLPGALTGARRMAKWASAHGYLVVHIEDSKQEVSINDVREGVERAITEVHSRGALGRIIFYFAGHGAAQSLNDTLWLLSKWRSNSSEAIRIPNLQSVLRTYHPAQVSIIGDSCRATHAGFLDLLGNAVLLRRNEEPKEFELDQFLAAVAGEAAFMVTAKDTSESFCIFTEVLLGALEGDIEKEAGISISAVTSGVIAKHLKEKVPSKASIYNVLITPDTKPGFVHPNDVYVTLNGGIVPSVERVALAGAPLEAVGATSAKARAVEELTKRVVQADSIRTDLNLEEKPTYYEIGAGLSVTGTKKLKASADFVVPNEVKVRRHPSKIQWFRVGSRSSATKSMDRQFADILVRVSAENWAYTFAVTGFVAALTVRGGMSVSVISRENGYDEDTYAQTEEIVARVNAGLIKGSEAFDLAARIRMNKHRDFVLGSISAHLYNSVGDIDNIRRMASYYAYHGQPIPFDIALLTGDLIRSFNGTLVMDVPEVSQREPRTDTERHYSYTYEATPRYEDVPILGTVPLLRQAWTHLEIAGWSADASSWRDRLVDVRKGLMSSPFTTLRGPPADKLACMIREGIS